MTKVLKKKKYINIIYRVKRVIFIKNVFRRCLVFGCYSELGGLKQFLNEKSYYCEMKPISKKFQYKKKIKNTKLHGPCCNLIASAKKAVIIFLQFPGKSNKKFQTKIFLLYFIRNSCF